MSFFLNGISGGEFIEKNQFSYIKENKTIINNLFEIYNQVKDEEKFYKKMLIDLQNLGLSIDYNIGVSGVINIEQNCFEQVLYNLNIPINNLSVGTLKNDLDSYYINHNINLSLLSHCSEEFLLKQMQKTSGFLLLHPDQYRLLERQTKIILGHKRSRGEFNEFLLIFFINHLSFLAPEEIYNLSFSDTRLNQWLAWESPSRMILFKSYKLVNNETLRHLLIFKYYFQIINDQFEGQISTIVKENNLNITNKDKLFLKYLLTKKIFQKIMKNLLSQQ